MNHALHFSSKRRDWGTPRFLFEGLNLEFRFELDVCATPENALCKKFYAPADDGLNKAWAKDAAFIWMNPPYGRAITAWVKKALCESKNGATVVCLLPARTDTAWWHRYCMRGEIRFLRGRLTFRGARNAAPFPSAVVIFRPPASRQGG